MIGRFAYNGGTVNYKATKDIAYREVVELGTRIGVAAAIIPNGEVGTLNITGVYELAATSSEEYKIGDIVYFKEEGVTKTKSSNEPVAGIVVAEKKNGTTTALVKID